MNLITWKIQKQTIPVILLLKNILTAYFNFQVMKRGVIRIRFVWFLNFDRLGFSLSFKLLSKQFKVWHFLIIIASMNLTFLNSYQLNTLYFVSYIFLFSKWQRSQVYWCFKHLRARIYWTHHLLPWSCYPSEYSTCRYILLVSVISYCLECYFFPSVYILCVWGLFCKCLSYRTICDQLGT